jgi:hypothetical protein
MRLVLVAKRIGNVYEGMGWDVEGLNWKTSRGRRYPALGPDQ